MQSVESMMGMPFGLRTNLLPLFPRLNRASFVSPTSSAHFTHTIHHCIGFISSLSSFITAFSSSCCFKREDGALGGRGWSCHCQNRERPGKTQGAKVESCLVAAANSL